MKKKIKNSHLSKVEGGAIVVVVNGDNNIVTINGTGVGSDDDTNASNNANNDTGDNTGTNSNNDTGDNTGTNANNDTGDNTGTNADDDTGDNTGTNANDDTGNNTGTNASNTTGNSIFSKSDEPKSLAKRLEKALKEKESLEKELSLLKMEKEEKKKFDWEVIWDNLENILGVIFLVALLGALVWFGLCNKKSKNTSETDEPAYVWETNEDELVDEEEEVNQIEEEDEFENDG